MHVYTYILFTIQHDMADYCRNMHPFCKYPAEMVETNRSTMKILSKRH